MTWRLVLVLLLHLVVGCEAYNGYLMKSLQDSVGAENFTYYTYSEKGPVILVLQSLTGDADLYVSDKSRNPTYIYDQYDMRSNTCGEDVLDLTSLKRPVYIGVYGTHAYDTSEYILSLYKPYASEVVALTSYDSNDGTDYADSYPRSHDPGDTEDYSDDSSPQGLLWQFLQFFFKILIEILL